LEKVADGKINESKEAAATGDATVQVATAPSSLLDSSMQCPISIIGDGYSKIVGDFCYIHELLVRVAKIYGSREYHVSSRGIMERLDKMEQSVKSLMELQLHNDCNLPSMVASEVETAAKECGLLLDKLKKKYDEGADVTKPKGDVDKALKMLMSVRSSSKELAKKLEGIVQSKEEKKEGGESGDAEASVAGNKKIAAEDVLMEDIDIDTSFTANDDDNNHDDDDILKETNDDIELLSPNHIDPHEESNQAKEKSNQVLTQLATILKDNPNFCSEARRKEWLEDVQQLMEKGSGVQTVFGVLGNTGVGKSSLLNGLLDEAAVLPTSGSRGCTAAVVELVFHSDLLKEHNDSDNKGNEKEGEEDAVVGDQQVPVYRGEVEFITLEDWRKELKALVDECSTQEKFIYARCPEEDSMPDAAQAWQKIEQVYGRGIMEQY